MDDREQMRRIRDRRLRRRLLETLYNARAFAPSGWYGARSLADMVNTAAGAGADIESEDHAMALLRDLANKDMIDVRDVRTRALQPYGLAYLEARISDKGSLLIEEAIPADPGIEDERL